MSLLAMTSSKRVVSMSPPEEPPIEPEGLFFSDSFANGQKNDSNGFTWEGIVRDVSISTTQAYDDTYSLRFRYETTSPNVEQNFDMGRYLNEFWMEWQVYFPSNYAHISNPFPSSATNNKFLAIWKDAYSSSYGTQAIVLELWPGANNGSKVRAMRYNPTIGLNGNFVDSTQWPNLIGNGGPVVLGAWNRFRLHVRLSSAHEVSDGFLKLYCNATTVYDLTGYNLHNSDTREAESITLRNGYFFGACNDAYSEQTDFFIDAVKFYDADPGW